MFAKANKTAWEKKFCCYSSSSSVNSSSVSNTIIINDVIIDPVSEPVIGSISNTVNDVSSISIPANDVIGSMSEPVNIDAGVINTISYIVPKAPQRVIDKVHFYSNNIQKCRARVRLINRLRGNP